MKLNEAVSLYIKLRDQKAAMKAEYEEKCKPILEKMDKLEAKLLEAFQTAGMDSIKTEFGTAYVSTRTSCSVVDREVFMSHVRTLDDWPLLEVRPAKSAVEQYRAANEGRLPPGVNWSEERVVNVRRAS